jgi:hypothetical protein
MPTKKRKRQSPALRKTLENLDFLMKRLDHLAAVHQQGEQAAYEGLHGPNPYPEGSEEFGVWERAWYDTSYGMEPQDEEDEGY